MGVSRTENTVFRLKCHFEFFWWGDSGTKKVSRIIGAYNVLTIKAASRYVISLRACYGKRLFEVTTANFEDLVFQAKTPFLRPNVKVNI